MPICPNGHQSGNDDWCEVCGHRMGAAVPPPPASSGNGYGYPAPGPGAGAPPELCPQCQTPREANAPYCEECRWNFLTNTATSYTPLAPRTPPGPAEPFGARPVEPSFDPRPPEPGFGARPHASLDTGSPEAPFETRPPDPFGAPEPFGARPPYERTGTRPSQINRPAEPLVSEPAPGPGPGGERPGDPDDPWGVPRPPRFERVSPPPAPQRPGPGFGDDWPPAPPAPAFDRGAPAPPAPAPAGPGGLGGGPDDEWRLPPPPQAEPFPPPPGMDVTAQQPMPPQPTQGGPAMPPPRMAASARWAVVIGPDRDYFLAMMQRSGPEAAGLNLPAYAPEQHMPLTGNQVTIGRRRHSTGESPDIDLAMAPEDPGVSHQHAMLVQQPDGGWAVVDQNSTNGTTLNGGEEPIQPFVPVPLADGDRVHVGAWTTIRIIQG